ncbi:MAG: choice-of-anchor tandem repeat GloVer-containing protein [Terriglobales bacterium]
MKTEWSSRLRVTAAGRVLAIAALGLVIAASANATENILFSFTGANGGAPDGTLIFDSEGNLYGTSVESATNANCPYGCGVVFELTPSAGAWTETILHQFTGGDDGVNPYSGLVFDSHGNLYGTTFFGGGTDCTDPYGDEGCGIVFMLSPSGGGDWKETVLYRFKGGDDGSGPFAEVIFDSHGNLYGTTLNGGNPNCVCGTVFKLTPKSSGGWKKTILHVFAFGDNEGQNPYGTLVFDKGGNLYGTTYGGGNYGTVFQLAPVEMGVWRFKLIHVFEGGPDGGDPYAGLILDAHGNLYGTTASTAFELTPNGDDAWTETVLYFFGDGTQFPTAPLVFDKDGNLYGTCLYGGPDQGDEGAVFKLTKLRSGAWSEKDILGFSGSNGYYPYYAGLIFDSKGDLYGVTSAGGSANDGVVFEIIP